MSRSLIYFIGFFCASTLAVEVVQVSATRLAKPVYQTPVALSNIVPTNLTEHPANWLNQKAGIWLTQTSGQEQLTAIRSPVLTGAGSCSAFYLSQDQIPLRATGFCNVNQLFESHSEVASMIEVVKGPSSAITGSNALFGSIDVALPYRAGSNELSLALKGDEYQQLNLGLGNELGVAWLTLHHDTGYRHSSGVEQQKLSVRYQTEIGSWQAQSGLSLNHLDQQTASFIEGKDAYLDKSLRAYNPTPSAYRKAKSIRAHSKFRTQLADGELAITPYFRNTEMEFLMHFVPWQPVEENRHSSLGTQLRYQAQLNPNLQYYLGGELEFTQGRLTELQPDPAPFSADQYPQGTHYDYQIYAYSLALDSGIQWQPSPKWSLEAGFRWDLNQFDYDNRLTDGAGCESTVKDCRFFRPADQTDTFSDPSGRLSLAYQVSASHLLYLLWNKAFRAPHTSELYRLQQGQQQAFLDSVQLSALELGQKLRFDQVQLQWAMYAMRREQVIFQNSERHYVGGAKTRHLGLEYELSWQFSENWQLTWAGQYAKHTYANSPDLLNSSVEIKGNEIDTAPRSLNSAQLSWQVNKALEWQLGWHQLGSYELNPENTLSYPGHQLWAMDAIWRFANTQLQLSITNLTDKAWASRADVSFGEERYLPGEGRRVQLTLQQQW